MYASQACLTQQKSSQGFHVVLSDMCHSTMGSSSADVLRSLDLASCAAELAVGSLEPTQLQQLPKVYSPMPEPSSNPIDSAQEQENQQPESLQDTAVLDGSKGVLLPKGHLVMKLLQVSRAIEGYNPAYCIRKTLVVAFAEQGRPVSAEAAAQIPLIDCLPARLTVASIIAVFAKQTLY